MQKTSGLTAALAAIVVILCVSCTAPQTPVYTPATPTASIGTETPVARPTEQVTPQPSPTKKANSGTQEKTTLSNVPRVEVVFVLDTTGSMSGLLAGAKQKIWSIANTILQAEPRPIIRMGLIGYRDKGDQYVTKLYELNDNMDKIYENLMAFQAAGGGDTPEHVNKALSDAINQIQWTKGKNVLRIIFLVGDAPPHMDYQDGFNYKKLCGEARQKDIFINSIRCGIDAQTEQYWRDIASLGGGKYASIDQTGGVVATVDTPMDKELADLNRELGTTIIAYGGKDEREGVLRRQSKSESLAPSVQAERAKYASKSHYMDKSDLVDAVKNKEVDVNSIEVAELPEELQTMDTEKRAKYIEAQTKKRDELKKKIDEVSKNRDRYISEKQRENKDSFDSQVVSFIKEQARTKGLDIK